MRKVNNIYVTQCVSFPRSGHHWLVDRLGKYFNGRLNYCEFYQHPESRMDICADTNYQKGHDSCLIDLIRNDIKYVIQIRNFEDAYISWYRYNRLNFFTGTDNPIGTQKPYVDIDSDDYINFKAEYKIYYDGFINKWINCLIPNSIVIHYENMLKDTTKEISSVIAHITDEPVDLDRLKSVL